MTESDRFSRWKRAMEGSDEIERWNHSIEVVLLLLLLLETRKKVEEAVLFWVAIPLVLGKPKERSE
jgi:hypothetical protein